MADERDEGLPPEYAEGRVCHFTTLSRVDEPLAAHLSPDYVRELVEFPDTEASLFEEVRHRTDRGESLPISMQRAFVDSAHRKGFPSQTRARWRGALWSRATERLERFGMRSSRAYVLIHHTLETIRREGGVVKGVMSVGAVRKTVERARSKTGTN